MGLKVPKDTDYIIGGRQCNRCTPELWQPGMTSKYVWAVFYDVTACPTYPDPPNNRLFKCEQHAIDACAYNGFILDGVNYWWAKIDLFNGNITLDYILPADSYAYFHGAGPPCSTYWPTNLRTCVAHSGTGGRALLGLMEDNLLHSLTMDYHFVPRDRTYYERQDVGVDHVLVRLASRKFSSNVLIYIDYEDFEYVVSPT